MPEEKDEEGKTLEKPESKEPKETDLEDKGKKPSKPLEPPKEDGEEEESEKPVEEPDIEPKKRFPKQTPEDNKMGYKLRKLEEENQRLKELSGDADLDDEEEKPVTRKELSELLEKKDKETASERMLNEFLSENPDFKKYEKRIRKYVNDPDYSNVPIGFIASGLIGENLDNEANERAKLKVKADEEAAKTRTGGSTKRIVPGKRKGIWDLSREEFEEKQAEVLRGQE